MRFHPCKLLDVFYKYFNALTIEKHGLKHEVVNNWKSAPLPFWVIYSTGLTSGDWGWLLHQEIHWKKGLSTDGCVLHFQTSLGHTYVLCHDLWQWSSMDKNVIECCAPCTLFSFAIISAHQGLLHFLPQAAVLVSSHCSMHIRSRWDDSWVDYSISLKEGIIYIQDIIVLWHLHCYSHFLFHLSFLCAALLYNCPWLIGCDRRDEV